MPDTKGSFFDYVTVHSVEDASTKISKATFCQIKPHVIEQRDWSWLPRTQDGSKRDNRLFMMAAAMIFQTNELKGVALHLSKAFREFTTKYSIRIKTIGGQ